MSAGELDVSHCPAVLDTSLLSDSCVPSRLTIRGVLIKLLHSKLGIYPNQPGLPIKPWVVLPAEFCSYGVVHALSTSHGLRSHE